jgi:hypothetical protein
MMSYIILKYFFDFAKLQLTIFFLSVSALKDPTSDPLGDLLENLGDLLSPFDDLLPFSVNFPRSCLLPLEDLEIVSNRLIWLALSRRY